VIIGVTFMSQEIIKDVDTSGDGKLDKKEFLKYFSG